MPDVTGITALDVGIGLAFVYLLFSVLCSALQEAIAGLFDLRARTLEDGLRNLLEDNGAAATGGAPLAVAGAPPPGGAAAAAGLAERVLSHGLIRTQYRKARWSLTRPRRGPSYIPSKTFALALLDIVAPVAPATAGAAAGTTPLATTIAGAPVPQGTKDALVALARDAGDKRDELRKHIEEWFDAGMDRVSGWYKRKAQLIVCGLALIVTIGLNVNTIAISDRLVRDDGVRAALVTEATNSTVKQGDSVDATVTKIGEAQKLGLPIGWNKQADDPARPRFDTAHAIVKTVGGWLITFVMLSLGAPFWFDLLGRLVGLRGAGKKPDPAPVPS